MTDFGIAKRAGNETTGLGVLLGTASYVSPEQVRGEPATPASDWYSFGCVLHELLAGTPPFTGPTADAVMRQHLDAPPPPDHADRRTAGAAQPHHASAGQGAGRPPVVRGRGGRTARTGRPDPGARVHTRRGQEDVIGVGTWEETSRPRLGRTERLGETFPLVKVGVAAAVCRCDLWPTAAA
jgi:serine/threonine-protein kinase